MFSNPALNSALQLVFWASLGIIIYTYLGYPILLGILVKLRKVLTPRKTIFYSDTELPEVTVLVACYNEADILEQKIRNTAELDYPVDKRKFWFVTDGSTDNSADLVRGNADFEVFHENARRGKNAAVNRVMKMVKTPIVVFCDANTILNREALKLLARHFKDPKVGAVAGEKRVQLSDAENAAGSGEGAYWKYESLLKKWDSQLNTVVGAAGELLAVRTSMYEEVPPGVFIEDFRLSMNIAKAGYRVIYEPDAYAMETASASIAEEKKRKVRISAGGLIEVWHFTPLMNFFKYGWLSFQYVSHRMLRWTLAPLSLLLLLISNAFLAASGSAFFQMFLLAQTLFYLVAILGYLLKDRKIGLRILFVPYYFLFMNLSVYQGLGRLIKGSQSAVWDKAVRSK
ncbi:MAG TPA: glycosyltransferase family 2 protein [Cyclobacteriaceae bacterium]|nr:glycosyltransferase family 2 protein [Cyclobacteriaceae bacterium]